MAFAHTPSGPTFGDDVVIIPAAPRTVIFHLSPYAKGCETAAVSDSRRGFTVYKRRPGQALAALFDKLEISPQNAEVTAMLNGELAIHPVGRPHQPWAFVWNGLTAAEALPALAALKARPRRRGQA